MGTFYGSETGSKKKRTSHNLTQMGFCHGYETRSQKKHSFHNLMQMGICHGYETHSRSKREGKGISRIRSISHKSQSSRSKLDRLRPNPTGVGLVRSGSADSSNHKKTKKDGSSSSSSSSSIKKDMFSNLPEDVKGQVLSLLPIKEAVRTSTLSKDWRRTWYSVPGLVISNAEIILDDDPRKVGSYYYRLIKNVDSMIVVHSGPALEDSSSLEDVRVCKMRGSMVNGDIKLESSPPLNFDGVKSIEFLRLNFEDENEAAFVLALLPRASHLQSLAVHVSLPGERETGPVAKFWETVNSTKIKGEPGLFKHLHTVNIVNIKNVDCIFSFLGFMMSASRLGYLLIGQYLVNAKDHVTIFNKLAKLKSSSPRTRIIFPKDYFSTILE